MITVMGASGRTGGRIATELLAAGEQVRAVGRSRGRLANLGDAGAEPMAGDANDAEFLAEAFRGADAVYTLAPYELDWPDLHAAADRMGESTAAAVRSSGVRHVVFLSSLGADLPDGTGIVSSLHRQEQRLRELADTNVLVLRAGYFFENFFAALDLVREHGINGDSTDPDVPLPMIATRDIADVAVRALRRRNWTGFVVRELLGQRDLTLAEATAILGERIGKPDLQYVRFSEADMLRALTEAGMSDDVARQAIEVNRAVSDRTVRSREGRRAENTTPTRFEEFAGELARAYVNGHP